MHWIDPQSLPPIKGAVAQFVMNRDELLKPGAAVAARGTAIVSPLGTMLDVHDLGLDEHSLLPVKKHKPDEHKEKKPKKPKHDQHADA